MYDFNYQKPAAINDAVKALGSDPEAKALAGGMTFIPVLKQRLAKPSTLVDLGGLGLSGIRREGNRYRGTIGGSLANNDPSACYPSAALALGATIRTTRREIAADDYFQGMFTTALEPDELIVEVSFPIPEKAAYEKFPNPASRYAMVGVFVAKTAGGARLAVTGAGNNGVFRHAAMEQALSANFAPDAIRDVKTPEEDMNSDIHASAAYRAHLVGVMARRAVASCG
ncbi:MAG: carbon monoxide dehydrogenase [Acidiphilium sp. 37-67-22]|nr:MAG: carbon monoxide dehydrogenase [Acidiphilium sp. 37-67-22]